MQVRDYGGLAQNGNGQNGEGWLDSGLDVGYRIKESRMTKILSLNNWKGGVAIF